MNRRNRSSRSRRFVSSPVALILALILLILLARAAVGIHTKAADAGRELSEAQANLSKLQENQASMQSKISQLSTDAGVETSIREKYHAVQPGESVAVVVDEYPDAAATDTPESTGPAESWWQRLLSDIGL